VSHPVDEVVSLVGTRSTAAGAGLAVSDAAADPELAVGRGVLLALPVAALRGVGVELAGAWVGGAAGVGVGSGVTVYVVESSVTLMVWVLTVRYRELLAGGVARSVVTHQSPSSTGLAVPRFWPPSQ
jgi:hypothetical protein